MKEFKEMSTEELYAVGGGSTSLAYETGKVIGRAIETGVYVVAETWGGAQKAWVSYATTVNNYFGVGSS